MTNRPPPQNIEAEQSVLGGIMLDNVMMNDVTLILRPGDFFKSAHQKIYSAMMELNEKDKPIDSISLNDLLKKKKWLKNVGDTPYILHLSSSVPTAANVMYYAGIVKEKSQLRKVVSAGITLSESAYNEVGDVGTFLDQAEQTIYDISNDKSGAPYHKIGSLISDTFNAIGELYHREDKITGIQSGFTDLDKLTAGFQPSDLIIIAARPSMGKTALALNIAMNSAHEYGKSVIIFSLEMSKEQLTTRMLCTEAQVDMQRVRTGYLKDADFPKLAEATETIYEAPIYIDDTPAITILELRAKCRRLKAEGNLALVIVDYLQLMTGRQNKGNVREQEISGISRSLKALAKELNVPVIALSQLNRALEGRDNKRPRLSDLRESGAIEQDADVIGFIYRDEVYKKDTRDRGVAELIIGKQRNGPTGTVKLSFKIEYTRFYDLSDPYDMSYEED